MQVKSLVFLDSGVLLNLLASGDLTTIFAESPIRFAIPAGVYEHSMLLGNYEPQQGKVSLEENDDAPPMPDVVDLIKEGIIEAYSLDDCLDEFVDLAVHLSDLQAKTVALARSQGGHVATDDRKLRRLVRDLDIKLPLHSTLEILRTWLTISGRSIDTAKAVAQSIAAHAGFSPLEDDPDIVWWKQLIE